MKKVTTPRIFSRHSVKAIASLGAILSLTAAFFSANVHAQGGGLWQANGSSIVFTNRFVGFGLNNPSERVEILGGFLLHGNAYIDSLLTVWKIQTSELLVNGNVQVTGLTTVEAIYATSLQVSGNTQLTNVQADSINTNYLSANSINSGQYLINGIPLQASPWTISGSDIYFNGKVGINTNTPPSFPLEVSGNAAVTGTFFADRIAVQSSISIGQFRFINGATQPGQADTIYSAAEIVVRSETERIALKADTVTVKERLGVGVEKPAVALDVAGDIRATGSLTAKTLNVSGAVFDSLNVNGVLHVADSIKIGNSIWIGAVNQNTGTNNTIRSDNGPIGLWALGSEAQNPYVFLSGFEAVMMGIPFEQFNSIFSPMDILPRKLIVASWSGDIITFPAHQGQQGLRIENYHFVTDFTDFQRSSWDFMPVTPVSTPPRLDINSVNSDKTIMTLMDTGNVGIGTTSPGTLLQEGVTSKLEVVGSGHTAIMVDAPVNFLSSFILAEGGNSTWQLLSRGNEGNRFEIFSADGSSSLRARLTILQNGNVGIGTTSPQHDLDIGSSNFGLQRQDVSPNAGYLRFGDNTGWKFHIARSQEFVGAPFNTNITGSLFTVQDNGNVGIGTTCPDERLTVNGRIRARTEVIVENIGPWCDYVFDDDYKRMTPKEKLEYYKKNKHLFGLQPGKEIEKNGLKVSKTLKGVTLNVEENSLDIIDQDARNDEQDERDDMLEKRINELEKSDKEKEIKIEKMEKENKQLRNDNKELRKHVELLKGKQ